jgi:hypothetical protein
VVELGIVAAAPTDRTKLVPVYDCTVYSLEPSQVTVIPVSIAGFSNCSVTVVVTVLETVTVAAVVAASVPAKHDCAAPADAARNVHAPAFSQAARFAVSVGAPSGTAAQAAVTL